MADTAGKGPPVTVNARWAGLGKMKAEWLDFAGNLLDPVLVLAAGGTKVQAAWAGVRGVMITKVLGPLGMVAGAAGAFLLTTRKLVGAWKDLGMTSSKEIERLTLQFKPLLGSLGAAKKRAKELFEFGTNTPFQFPDVAEGGKMLESLTRGALTTEKGMRMVGDAATVAGVSFAEMSQNVGRLYDGLMSGRPVGMVSQRLQELGVISGATRNQIEAMQASGAAGAEVWRVAAADFGRFGGAMRDMEGTLAGLESAWADTKRALEAGFSNGFLEGEKAGVKSSIDLMNTLRPAVEDVGEAFGMVSNGWARFKAWVVSGAASVLAFSGVLEVATVGLVGFAGAILLGAGMAIAQFVVGIVSATVATKALQSATVDAAAAEVLAGTVTGRLAAARLALAAALAATKAGHYAAAAAALRLAVAETVAAVRTNGAAAAQGILRGALWLTMGAAKLTAKMMWTLATAIFATPVGWIAALLVAAGGAMMYFHNKTMKAAQAQRELAAAAAETVAKLKEELLAAKSVADLRKSETDIVTALAAAYAELETAKAKGDAASATVIQRKIANLQKLQDGVRKARPEKDEQTVAREDFLKAAGEAAKETERDAASQTGEETAVKVARERLAEQRKKAAAAADDVEEQKRIERLRQEHQRGKNDRGPERAALEAKQEQLRGRLVEKEAGGHTAAAGVIKDQLFDLDAQLKALEKLEAADTTRIAKEAAGSKSEVVRIKEKIALFDALVAAQATFAQAAAARESAGTGEGLSGAEQKKQEAEAQAKSNAALEALQQARAAARAGGVGEDFDRLSRQEAERNLKDLAAKQNDALDTNKDAQLALDLAQKERDLAQARLASEQQILSYRLRGYEREKMMLDMDEKRLAMAMKSGSYDQERGAREKADLDARREQLEREATERQAEVDGANAVGGLRRREEAAREAGRQEDAAALRAAGDAREDALTRESALRTAEGLKLNEDERRGFADRQVEEAQAIRRQARLREEAGQALDRKETAARQRGAVGVLEERLLQERGKPKAAQRHAENLAREMDAVEREKARKGYIGQGYGADEAKRRADTDVKTAQAQRLMDLMGNGGSAQVVASSLAEIGGGGRTFGGTQERQVDLLKEIERLLSEIRDTSRENVGMGGML